MEYKGYRIVPTRGFPMFEVKAKGSGQVPAALTGRYTSRTDAELGVDNYLSSLLKGKKTNGKTKSSGTG